MFCRIGNTLCKGNSASDAADPFGNSDLCKEEQHPKTLIWKDRGRMHRVHKHLARRLESSPWIWKPSSRSAGSSLAGNVTRSCALPLQSIYIFIYLYTYFFFSPSEFVLALCESISQLWRHNNSWSRTEHTMSFHKGQRQSRDFTHICAAWETSLMCGDTDKGKSRKDKWSCS